MTNQPIEIVSQIVKEYDTMNLRESKGATYEGLEREKERGLDIIILPFQNTKL